MYPIPVIGDILANITDTAGSVSVHAVLPKEGRSVANASRILNATEVWVCKFHDDTEPSQMPSYMDFIYVTSASCSYK